MTGALFSSGVPAVDSRAGFAENMAHLGDLPAAICILEQALELAPDWAAGWFRLGEYLKAAGDIPAAADAWTRAVEADPKDPLGAGINRDLAREVPVTETLPPAFVELLFDQYAPRFERALRDRLVYRGPEEILAALKTAGLGRADHALDLGCGTGLMGELLRPHVTRLDGLDLSQHMLHEAEAKGVYDLLEKQNIATLDRRPGRYDLIVAADVFNYLGALEQPVAWAVDALRPGGLFSFTVELGDAPVLLRETRRFAHSRDYVETLLADAGLTVAYLAEVVLREDRGEAVRGLTVAARRGMPMDRATDGSELATAD
ncbi:methyltransferase [Sagittula stellata]|uniref:Methyltransferase type 12 domain-containing protein n=1 Tax=Sagittula stellata (strain ATCC 700073 / DSM 11524 / E-37) TaxID=388399 RepID=A3JZN2_SAGS3|nr:methyltransferase [Sagittula stellata]EBA09935.1 hypothetical protein SSE37_09003 [Sagittula stellata E-37]